MTGEKIQKEIIGVIFSFSLILTSIITILVWNYYSNLQFRNLGNFCERLIREYPEEEQNILELLKAQTFAEPQNETKNILTDFVYQKTDFEESSAVIFYWHLFVSHSQEVFSILYGGLEKAKWKPAFVK